jgi:hypothetical protein
MPRFQPGCLPRLFLVAGIQLGLLPGAWPEFAAANRAFPPEAYPQEKGMKPRPRVAPLGARLYYPPRSGPRPAARAAATAMKMAPTTP